MISGIDPISCTPQLGRPGLWSDRLPHFRMDYTPSNGEEIQSEYLLPRRHAIGAIETLRALADEIRPTLLVSEIRRVAADRLWMSTSYEQDSVAFHFTWKREPDAVQEITSQIEDALTPFEARPHWGKVFHADAAAIAALYPRYSDFVRLVEQLDTRGAFCNAWLKAHVLGDK
jgi:xylitol oxidase